LTTKMLASTVQFSNNNQTPPPPEPHTQTSTDQRPAKENFEQFGPRQQAGTERQTPHTPVQALVLSGPNRMLHATTNRTHHTRFPHPGTPGSTRRMGRCPQRLTSVSAN